MHFYGNFHLKIRRNTTVATKKLALQAMTTLCFA